MADPNSTTSAPSSGGDNPSFNWMSMVPVGIGALQAYQGFSALNKLQKQPLQSYTVTPELTASRARAEQMAQSGFTPEETAAFQQKAAAQDNQRYRLATSQAGGNLAGAISSGIQYGNIGRQLGFSGQDAQLHRQNIKYADTFGQMLQNLRNMNTHYLQTRRQQQEMGAGQAAQQGINNIAYGAEIASNAYHPGSGGSATGATGRIPSQSTFDTSGYVPNTPTQQVDYAKNLNFRPPAQTEQPSSYLPNEGFQPVNMGIPRTWVSQ